MKEKATRLQNDASASAKGHIFQYYIALRECFEMVSGQCVVIETFGDVTVPGIKQIETKHEKGYLTDSSESFWNTIKNWLQKGFDAHNYRALIYLTTQEFGVNAKVKEWNESDGRQRIKLLKVIYENSLTRYKEKQENGRNEKQEVKVPNVLRLMKEIFDVEETYEKLQEVCQKIWISDGNDGYDGTYNNLSDKNLKGIIRSKRSICLDALVGWILNPHQSGVNKWEITYEQFDDQVAKIRRQYGHETMEFPRKNYDYQPSDIEKMNHAEKLFVKKIYAIEYHSRVTQAIDDYIRTSMTILEEFVSYEIPDSAYVVFLGETVRSFEDLYSNKLRNAKEVVKDSQNFYDDFHLMPIDRFPGYEPPFKFFRNGVIHMQLDDSAKKLKWRLEDNG